MDERALRHGDTGPAVTLTTGGSGGNAGDQGSAATGAESGQGAEPTTGGTSGSGGGSGGSSAARGGSSGGSSGSHGGSAGGRAGTSGTGSDAGEGAVGVGTAGVDNSGPCAGEECSCAGLGANDCARQSCCTSLTLPAGTFTLGDGEATIAAFRLDAFEVTVGRFRRFVEAYLRPPAPDSGQNDYVIGSGWMPEWFAQMPLDQELRHLVRGLCVLRLGRRPAADRSRMGVRRGGRRRGAQLPLGQPSAHGVRGRIRL